MVVSGGLVPGVVVSGGLVPGVVVSGVGGAVEKILCIIKLLWENTLL